MFHFLQIKQFFLGTTQRSLIDTFLCDTFMIKEDISTFWGRVNCLNRPCTFIQSVILIHFVYTLYVHWTMSCKFKSTFTFFCIVESVTSSSMCCWRETSQRFPRPIPTATCPFDDLLLLEFYFMLPVAKCLCSNRCSVFFGRVSWTNIRSKISHDLFIVFPVCGCSWSQTLTRIHCSNV
jgi:hypothetical protein